MKTKTQIHLEQLTDCIIYMKRLQRDLKRKRELEDNQIDWHKLTEKERVDNKITMNKKDSDIKDNIYMVQKSLMGTFLMDE